MSLILSEMFDGEEFCVPNDANQGLNKQSTIQPKQS